MKSQKALPETKKPEISSGLLNKLPQLYFSLSFGEGWGEVKKDTPLYQSHT